MDFTERGKAWAQSHEAHRTWQVFVTEENVERAYRVLADLEVTLGSRSIFVSDPTRQMVAAKLREEAAAIGADAVIFVRYGVVGLDIGGWRGSYGRLDGRGRAIAFVDTDDDG
jgi:hypothetical protein